MKFKRSKHRKIISQVTKYSEIDPPYSIRQIADITGINKGTVVRYRKKLAADGLLPIFSKKGWSERKIGFRAPEVFNREKKEFLALPVMTKFIEKCEMAGQNHQRWTSPLFTICKWIKADPSDFITSFEDAEVLYSKFVQMWNKKRPKETSVNYRKAMRKFLQMNSIVIPPKSKTIPSDSDARGDYANVALDDMEFTLGLRFFAEQKERKFLNLFALYHEMFPRPMTLMNWTPNHEVHYVEVDGKSYPFAKASVYENKQAKHYEKMILDKRVLGILEKVPKHHKLVEGDLEGCQIKFSSLLKKFYSTIGKIDPEVKYEKGVDGWMYQNRPIYTLRHSAASLWLRRTSFNSNLVATMGWEDSKTLDKFYAKTTVDNLMQTGICYYHNPPQIKTNKLIFCSPAHAVAYYHGGSPSG